jgi:hypothetical protein
MTDPPTSVSDVSPASQCYHGQQNHRDSERRGRFWPFDWRSDSKRAQSCKNIENPDEILSAMLVFIKPGFSVFVSHRQNTIVTLLAKFINWPRRDRAKEHER